MDKGESTMETEARFNRAKRSMGWLRDYPDFRDYTMGHDIVPEHIKLFQPLSVDTVRSMLRKTGVGNGTVIPAKIDVREWCSPIEDQGALGSCTAQAAASLVEYFERRAFGKHIDVSRRFLYKTTRNLMHATGDTGAFLRSTMGALVLFGVPPEEYWPYNPPYFDKEPPAFCYAFAQNYKAINYYRLDTPGVTPQELLKRIRENLVLGLPSMFGFTVYNSIDQADASGKIPFPSHNETIQGGHAITAVGYDDGLVIKNGAKNSIETIGALLIRNSWGTGWGMNGYGWFPYAYVLRGLADDFWSLVKNEWVDTGNFGE